MNTYNFSPTLFDATVNGVYTFNTVLSYHKSVSDHMPIDGIVWLCEHPNLSKLQDRQKLLKDTISTIERAIDGQPYEVWKILDKQAHLLKSRLQLVTLCIGTITE